MVFKLIWHSDPLPVPGSSLHYREAIPKLIEAGARFKEDQPEFVVALGDIIDAADSVETELGYLKKVKETFAIMPGDKHFVLGNHCVHTLTKMEFLKEVEQQESFYSFDAGPISCLTTAQITASILGR